jgi:hypothetical protein
MARIQRGPTPASPPQSKSRTPAAPHPPFAPNPPLSSAAFLDQSFWSSENSRFLQFAERQRRILWPSGTTSGEEYVQTAAHLLIEGVRHCPIHITRVNCVLKIICSLILNDRDRAGNRITQSLTGVAEQEGESKLVDAGEEAIIALELVRVFQGDIPPQYRTYVYVLASGECVTAEDRARAMGVTVRKIRSLDKAVRRLRSLWKGSPPPEKKK